MDKYIGRLLDNRYEILEVIGTGGMAVVYKARCHRLNRLVAIKILKDDFLEDEEFRRRFHSESQAVAMLSHPNIISVYDVSTSITADYIVMELIDGITLKQYMEKKGVLNWKETLHFAIQIAKALEHAHSRGIVHRDIKPHNVMVLKNGSVKVTDFGIARVMSKGNTLTKEALGSVHYISPEQAKGGRVDNRSDIYSLGVVMYEMMSGRPPYDGESPVSVAIQHINGGAAMPSTLNPNIPGGLEQIIMRAMAHEPVNRYATAVQMLADLDDFRKDPSILFDYNTPPTDAVTDMPRPEQPKQDMPDMIPLVVNKTPEPAPAEPPAQSKEPLQPQSIAENKESKGVGAAAGMAATPPRRPERRTQPQPRQSQREAELEARQNKVTTIAIISCAVVMVLAIVVFLFILLGDGDKANATVPNLVGKTYDAATSISDFKVIKSDEVYNDAYPAGTIVSHSPVAGESRMKGSKIYVTVSLGPQLSPVEMPNLVGKERIPAIEELENFSETNKLGLVFDRDPEKGYIVEQFHESIPEGVVISTEPAPGTILVPGQEVKIVVSKGKEIKETEMPDLEGEKFEQAKKMLEDQKLDLVIVPVYAPNETYDVDYVFSTDPPAGTEIKTGQTITLNVSSGKQIIKDEMPELIGKTKQEAEDILNAKKEVMLALDIQIVEESSLDIQAGKVIRTEPAAASEIQTGDTIKVYVSSGPKKFAMPNLQGMSLSTAKDILKSSGYDTTLLVYAPKADKAKQDTVIEQSVIEGNMVAVNEVITLTFSTGTPPTDEPQPSLPVTKQVPVIFDTVPDSSGSVRFYQIDEGGNKIRFKTQTISANQTSVTISLTGNGTIEYYYEFYFSGGRVVEGGTFEVNFDE